MTETEELRRLLDERGVEWEEDKPYGANAVTRFKVNDVWLRYVDYGDYQWLDYHESEPLTPKQVIAATLGRPTTHAIIVSDESTDGATAWCKCERCGGPIDQWDHHCRHCGAEVESDE